MNTRYILFVCLVSTALLLTSLLLPPSFVLAANKPGTRDLVYEEEEPKASKKAEKPKEAPDRDLGPGPFYKFSPQEQAAIKKALDEAGQLKKQQKNAEAVKLLNGILAEFASLPQEPDPKTNYTVHSELFSPVYYLGRYAQAEKVAKKKLGLAEQVFGADSKIALLAKDDLAVVIKTLGRTAEVTELQANIFSDKMKAFGLLDEGTLYSGLSYVASLREMNLYDDAYELGEKLLELAQKKYKPNSEIIQRMGFSLVDTLLGIGDYDAAEQIVEGNLKALGGKPTKDNEGLYFQALQNLAVIAMNGPKKDYAKGAKILEAEWQRQVKNRGGDHPATLDAQMNVIRSQAQLKNFAVAKQRLEALLPTLAKALGEEHPKYLNALRDLGQIRLDSGDADGAISLLQDLLPTAQGGLDKQLPMRVAGTLRKAFMDKGDLETAAFFGRQAVNTGQTMRRQLKDAAPGIQKSFARSLNDYYQGLADVLMAQGKTAEAQKAMGLLKENELADLAIGAEAPKPAASAQAQAQPLAPSATPPSAPKADMLTGMDEKIAGRYNEINNKVVALAGEQRALLDKRAQGETLSPQEEERLKSLRQDMTTARQAFTAFMKNLSGELAQGDKRTADLGNLETYQRLLTTLGDGVVLLQTIVTGNRIWLILTTPHSQVAKESPFDVQKLPEKITAFRDMLQEPEQDPRPLAKEFYDAIVGPMAPALEQSKAKMVMFSLDGQLRYIPMAALHDGQEWLIQKYNVSLFNDATKAGLAVPPMGNWKVAGLGVTKEHKYGRGKFTALPAVKDELMSIVRTKDNTSGVLNGTMTLDEGFTADRLQDVLETGYPVIHLASHFHFDKKNPEQSFLLLGDGTGLPLTRIESEDFKFKNVDLLALSACQTARGGVDASGKEIEGFGALAQKRGAKAVLATLWPVFDESTGLLMSNFYRLHQDASKPSIATTLRTAQLQMIDNKIAGKDFKHPYYWAPFVLMGDWR
jgi:CHAT domain-containing protein